MVYLARNDFLHGNPVKPRNMFIKNSAEFYPLVVAAPIVYKIALQSFLQMSRADDIPDDDIGGFINTRNFEEGLGALIQKRPQRKKRGPNDT